MNALSRVVLALIIILLIGCSASETAKKEYRESGVFFDSFVTIRCLYDRDKNIITISDKCWERLEEIHLCMNSRSPSGDVADINRVGISSVQVDEDLYYVLRKSLELSKITRGAFDVTVLPLIELWKGYAAKNIIPSEEKIAEVRKKTGYAFIESGPGNTVYFKSKESKIDLGGIAKGYALDEIAGILRGYGINDFLIEAGGDMRCGGLNTGGEPWKVGIRDPEDKHSIIGAVYLNEKAVATSGDYERFFVIEGKKFAHIIDPRSGYPQKGVVSATVIAPTALEADALSTALCVMGGKEGTELINTIPEAECVIFEKEEDENKKFYSAGFHEFEKPPLPIF